VPRQSVDQGALAGLDGPDHRDAQQSVLERAFDQRQVLVPARDGGALDHAVRVRFLDGFFEDFHSSLNGALELQIFVHDFPPAVVHPMAAFRMRGLCSAIAPGRRPLPTYAQVAKKSKGLTGVVAGGAWKDASFRGRSFVRINVVEIAPE